MRFAIATADKFGGVFESLLGAGWKPLKLFTFAFEGKQQGEAVAATAVKLGVPVQLSRLEDSDLAELGRQGCQALVVANYAWRIGDWGPHLRYAVNFHPSPLPEGRGPWPLARALQEGRRRWGVSCHKLSADFDSGEVLERETLELDEDETQESLDLRCQMAMRRLASRVAQDLPGLWERARAQGEGSYWRRPTEADCALDLAGSVDDAKRQLRAFGLMECTARLGPSVVYVRRAAAWHEAHGHAPGQLIHANQRSMVFALKDGCLALLEWSHVPLALAGRSGR